MTPALLGLGMEDPTNTVAHLIQTALTPVFLLSGIGVLLGVFNTRLARVSDHMAHATDLLRGAARPEEEAKLRVHLRRLAHRMLMLDASVALGAIGGASTCGAASSCSWEASVTRASPIG
jgi:hypothetical protein